MISKQLYVKSLGNLVQSDGNLSTNVKDLAGRLISIRYEAYARIHTSGKEDIGNSEGTRVSMLVYYLKGENPVLQKQSRFSSKLARLLVEANSQNKYFSTGLEKEYEKARKSADKQAQDEIAPEKRNAIVCPSRDVFEMSPNNNLECLSFVFEDLAQKYHQKNNASIKFYPISKDVVDGKNPNLLTNINGTIVNYLWFGSLGGGSGLIGNYGDADFCSDWARGVLSRGEATAKKIQHPNLKEIIKYSRRFVPEVAREEFAKGLKELF